MYSIKKILVYWIAAFPLTQMIFCIICLILISPQFSLQDRIFWLNCVFTVFNEHFHTAVPIPHNSILAGISALISTAFFKLSLWNFVLNQRLYISFVDTNYCQNYMYQTKFINYDEKCSVLLFWNAPFIASGFNTEPNKKTCTGNILHCKQHEKYPDYKIEKKLLEVSWVTSNDKRWHIYPIVNLCKKLFFILVYFLGKNI